MYANSTLEIQSEYFENGKNRSIEGCNIEIVDKELNDSCEYHSHFSNDRRQKTFYDIYLHDFYVRVTENPIN